MTTYSKNYIGKGKKVNNLDIVTVTINMEEAEAHIFEFEGKKYLRFELAALKQADNYGKTHTAYVSQREVARREKTGSQKTRIESEKELGAKNL